MSPFIAISSRWRLLLIGWVVVYQILVPGFSILLHGAQHPYPVWRFAANTLYQLLLIAPVIFYRKEFGWLHPLIFGTIFGIGSQFARDPGQLLTPFLIFQTPLETDLRHAALSGWGYHDLAWVAVETTLISALAMVAYYAGYFLGPRLKVPSVRFPRPKNLVPKVLGVVGVAIAIFVTYVEMRGGLATHFTSLAMGRFRSMAGTGHITTLTQVGVLGCLAWYGLEKKASRNPLFWTATAVSLFVVFFINGSRGAIVMSLVYFLVVWMMRHRRIPAFKTILVAISALIVMGVLGELRETAQHSQTFDTEVLTDFEATQMVERTFNEAAERAQVQGPKGVIGRVPDDVDLLYGESYIGVLFFFVPRAVWPDKPRGVGAMHGQRILGYDHEGTGVPVGDVAEAYWNFHIPGVIVIFFLFGMLHRWLARAFRRYHDQPGAWLLYTFLIVEFGIASTQMIPFFHKFILMGAILWFLRALRFRTTAS